jgi:hypothetical protein
MLGSDRRRVVRKLFALRYSLLELAHELFSLELITSDHQSVGRRSEMLDKPGAKGEERKAKSEK